MGLSDFIDAADLGGAIAGVKLENRLYHCRQVCSGFQHANVILDCERQERC